MLDVSPNANQQSRSKMKPYMFGPVFFKPLLKAYGPFDALTCISMCQLRAGGGGRGDVERAGDPPLRVERRLTALCFEHWLAPQREDGCSIPYSHHSMRCADDTHTALKWAVCVPILP